MVMSMFSPKVVKTAVPFTVGSRSSDSSSCDDTTSGPIGSVNDLLEILVLIEYLTWTGNRV